MKDLNVLQKAIYENLQAMLNEKTVEQAATLPSSGIRGRSGQGSGKKGARGQSGVRKKGVRGQRKGSGVRVREERVRGQGSGFRESRLRRPAGANQPTSKSLVTFPILDPQLQLD